MTGLRGAPLVERDAETAALNAALEDVRAGLSRLVVVEGVSGIGKTSLLEATADAARAAGTRVAMARCSDLERDHSFGVTRQLFAPLLAGDATQRAELLFGAAGLASTVLESGTPPGAADAGPDSGYPALHGFYWLVVNLCSRGPLVLVVDDAQWADAASLRVLEHMVRRLDGMPVLMVLSVTTGEEPVDADLLVRITGGSGATTMRPRALTEEAVTRLVQEEVPGAGAELCAACAVATGGNPLLLLTLARTLDAGSGAAAVSEHGPPEVARIVLRQLRRQSDEAVWLVQALAVLDRSTDSGPAAELAGLKPDQAAEAVAALVRSELVVDDAGGLAFTHPVVGRAVYSSLGPTDRSRLHFQAAARLDAAHAVPEQVATHLLRTLPQGDRWTVAALRGAATSAARRGAPEQAAAYLRRALAEEAPESVPGDLLGELGTVELHVDAPTAAGHLDRAVARTVDLDARATLALRQAQALASTGQVDAAVEALRSVSAPLHREGSARADEVDAEMLFYALQSPHTLAGVSGALAELDRLLDSIPVGAGWGAGHEALLRRHPHMLAVLAIRACWSNRPHQLVADLCGRALTGGPAPGETASLLPLYATMVLAATGDVVTAQRILDEALRGARRRGSVLLHATVSWTRSQLLVLRGEITEASADAQVAVDALEPDQWQRLRLVAFAAAIAPTIERGDIDAAVELIEREGMSGDLPVLWLCNPVLVRRGQLRRLRGDGRRAVADLLECGRRAALWGAVNPAVLPWRSEAALALHDLGESVRAEELATEELELAERWGTDQAVGRALRVAGRVAGGTRGLALLTGAVDLLTGSTNEVELARALIDHGSTLHAVGHGRAAREQLRRGWELAERHGALAVARQAHDALVATGARPRRHSRTGPESLSPSEHRVASLVAGGSTNREAAQTLFVTEQTVEIHLTNAYRKLRITSRSQLTRALRPDG